MTKPMCVCVCMCLPSSSSPSLPMSASTLSFLSSSFSSPSLLLIILLSCRHTFFCRRRRRLVEQNTHSKKRLTSPLRQTPSGEMKEEGRSCRTHYSDLPLFFAFWRATITQRVSVQTTDCVNNQPSPATKCECRLASAIGRRQFSNVEEKKGEEIA